MSDRIFDRVLPWVLAIAALAYLLPLRAQGLMMLDDGWYLQPVLRMRDGEILYRDVWTTYAPALYHVLAWLFALTGPSMLVARTLFAVLIAMSAVLTYRLARRFVPPLLALLPAVVYVAAPGPWHKAYYATCSVAFFVLLARVFEHPRAGRFAALGLVAGVSLVTRQDLGLAEFGLLGAAIAILVLSPAASGRANRPASGRLAGWLAAALAGFAVPLVLTAAYYGPKGALPDLFVAVFERAFTQMQAHPSRLGDLLAPATFGVAPEGRWVGTLMILPLLLYPALGIALLLRLRRGGMRSADWVLGALLVFALSSLAQAYLPMMLLRFLQSALPFYLLATIGAWRAARWLDARGRRRSGNAVLGLLVVAAAVHVGGILSGLPSRSPAIFSGSAQMLRYAHPVDVLGETFYEDFGLVEEVRQVRAFFATHASADEPTLALPAHALYNVLLERDNPTRYLIDHPTGNFFMNADEKRAEAGRLRDSDARYVIADQHWYARGGVPDPLLTLIRDEFHPVRGYGTVLVLERGSDPAWRAFGLRLRRAIAAGPNRRQLAASRQFAESHPQEPLAWRMLALAQQAAGDATAIASLQRAAALDPADATPLEERAAILERQGRGAEARSDLASARAIRDSEAIRALSKRLDAKLP